MVEWNIFCLFVKFDVAYDENYLSIQTLNIFSVLGIKSRTLHMLAWALWLNSIPTPKLLWVLFSTRHLARSWYPCSSLMFATMLISNIWVPWHSIRCFPTALLSHLWSAFHRSPIGINSTRFPLLLLVISHSLTLLPSLILPVNPDCLAVLREPILSCASTLW